MEIQKKFSIIRPTDNIVDLGAAPGSWLQVERNLTTARVLGIDLNPIAELAGVETIEGDLNDPAVIALVKEKLPVVNIVLCDAAPKLSGHKSYDQARIIELNEQALVFACNVLKQGGNFAIKSFQGTDFPELYADCKKHFYSVKTCITKSSRKGSTELYIVAKNFIGQSQE
jgi:23S rRNA (uridine2552-2'-O)-methyltransferase